MTETLAAMQLGLVQGLTEFLPVSSSGHLVLFQQVLPVVGDPVAFDLVLHLGTLVPVLVFYRGDLAALFSEAAASPLPLLRRPGVRLLLLLGAGSIPTAAIGVAFEHRFEAMFTAPAFVGFAFALTGLLLFLTRWAPPGRTGLEGMRVRDAVLVGLAQGAAITPGISRSGATIATALFLGIERELAARFSFLLSVPAILGAFAFRAPQADFGALPLAPLAAGFLSAALSGYVALILLVRVVRAGSFSRFAWYLWPLAAFAMWSAART